MATVRASGWSICVRWSKELKAKTPESLWQVILKRVMLIGANTIADKARAGAIVTGEAIGQVSSQTLDNLAAIEAVADLPVLRPLLTFDKYEIVALARRIGSYDLSASVPEYCALQGRGPAIAATTDELDRAEEALDLRGFVDSLADAPRLDLRGRTRRGQAAAEASLAVSEVPESAVVIDLRSSAAFATWHYPGALRMDYSEAARALPPTSTPREPTSSAVRWSSRAPTLPRSCRPQGARAPFSPAAPRSS